MRNVNFFTEMDAGIHWKQSPALEKIAGFFTNPQKTALVFLNFKQKGDPIKITIGGETIT